MKKEKVHAEVLDYFINQDDKGWETVNLFGAIKKRTDNSTSIAIRHRTYQGKLYVDLAQWKKKLDGTLTRTKKGFHLDIETFLFLVELIKDYSKSINIKGDLSDPKSIQLVQSSTYIAKSIEDRISEKDHEMIRVMTVMDKVVPDGCLPCEEHP